MEKIEFYHSIYTLEETNSMGQQLILAIEGSKYTDDSLQLAKEAIEKSNGKLTIIVNAQKKNPFTDPLRGTDKYRDDTYWGGRDVINGMTHWVFNTEKQEAAARIKEILKRHAWKLHKLPYQDQSSATNSLIKELKEAQNQKDLETLGLMEWFNAVVESQASFESIHPTNPILPK